MSVTIVIRKVRRNLNDYGLAKTAEKTLSYLFKSFYLKRTYLIYRMDLSEYRCPPITEDFTFRTVGTGDIQVIRQIEEESEWLDGRLRECLAKGLCVVALDGEQVAGFNLIAFDDVFIPLLNLKRRLRPHEAWSEQITVMKEYRKRGLASALRRLAFSELQQRGIRKLYGGALTSNIPSLKLAKRVGFRFITIVDYRRVLNREQRIYNRVNHGTR